MRELEGKEEERNVRRKEAPERVTTIRGDVEERR